jgi:tight adherence protein C
VILATTILLDIALFALVVFGVTMAERRLEAGLTVRRRVRGEAAPQPAAAPGSVLRRDRVRNPVLAWVQNASLNDPKERSELRVALIHAGFPSPSAPAWYVVIRFGLAVGLPVAFVLSQQLFPHPASRTQLIVIPLILCAMALIIPRVFINSRANARRSEIEHEFPDALDLMVVCVEAGLALEAAFIRVGEETIESHPRISQEFRLVSQELRAGSTREQALRGLADRTQVDAVKSFVALLIQTDALGVSIAQSLRTYSKEMRAHRMIKAEEKALRIPVLLTVPLVTCILPVIVVSVLLPSMLEAARHLLPALQAGR